MLGIYYFVEIPISNSYLVGTGTSFINVMEISDLLMFLCVCWIYFSVVE